MKEANVVEQIKSLKEAYVNETEEVNRRRLFFEIYDLEHELQHTWVSKNKVNKN